MILLYQNQQILREWASLQLFGYDDAFDEKTVCVGVGLDHKIIACVIYNNMQVDNNRIPYTMEMSIASIDKRWCNRHNLRAFFNVPFTQYKLRRVSTRCSANEEGIIMFNKRLGFKPEGYHKAAFPDGSDAVSFGMLKKDCRWIHG